MSATISFQAEGRVLALVDIFAVDTGVGIGLERVDTGVFGVSSEGREVERFEAGVSAECFTE
jgi:hypothetical protein